MKDLDPDPDPQHWFEGIDVFLYAYYRVCVYVNGWRVWASNGSMRGQYVCPWKINSLVLGAYWLIQYFLYENIKREFLRVYIVHCTLYTKDTL